MPALKILTLAAAAVLVPTLLGGAAPRTAAAATRDLPAPTATAPVAVNHSPGSAATVTGIRSGRHPGYDRIVLDLSGPAPSWSVRYVPRIVQDGSGRPLSLQGRAFLQIVVHPATGHAVSRAPQRPALPTLQEVRLAGDFEGYVTVGVGLADRVGFRAFELTSPRRLVVDVAHVPSGCSG